MSADLLLAVIAALVSLGGVAVIIAAVMIVSVLRPPRHLPAEVEAARRHGLVTSGIALAVFLTAPALLLLASWVLFGSVGPSIRVAPLASSAAALLALLVGELTWPRPRGATRSALLADRSVGSLVRGRWARATGTSAGLLALTVLAGSLLSDGGDSLGGGPFPGWHYGAPQGVGMLLVLGLVALVLRATNRRAAVVRADLETDRLLRRCSAARAYRAAVGGLLLTVSGDLMLGGLTAFRVYNGPAEVAAAVTALVGVAAGLAALAALVTPAPRVIASASPSATSSTASPVTA